MPTTKIGRYLKQARKQAHLNRVNSKAEPVMPYYSPLTQVDFKYLHKPGTQRRRSSASSSAYQRTSYY